MLIGQRGPATDPGAIIRLGEWMHSFFGLSGYDLSICLWSTCLADAMKFMDELGFFPGTSMGAFPSGFERFPAE